jgi:hypothetical protein
MPIYVLLIGGSSALPIIQDLADTILHVDRASFKLQKIAGVPSWIERLPRDVSQLVGATYLQSAVSIGGAPELPKEISDLIAPITPPLPGERRLERYQVTGMG